ncbi:MAG: prolyl-tRNA synthetase associated domain-containing protein [Sphingomonadales bacterium]
MANERDLFNLLNNLGIEYTLYRHEPFFTVKESRAAREDWVGGHCKCLFLKDKKANMVLAVVQEDLKVDLKALAGTLKLGRFSFCDEARMVRVLGVTPGAVNPFSVMNVKELNEVESFQVVVDASLKNYEVVHFHPLHNEATVGISFDDLIRFIENYDYEPRVLDLSF